MLTDDQLKDIASRPTKDVTSLLEHIREIMQKALCEHNWVYYFDRGFECPKCLKKKDRKRG